MTDCRSASPTRKSARGHSRRDASMSPWDIEPRVGDRQQSLPCRPGSFRWRRSASRPHGNHRTAKIPGGSFRRRGLLRALSYEGGIHGPCFRRRAFPSGAVSCERSPGRVCPLGWSVWGNLPIGVGWTSERLTAGGGITSGEGPAGGGAGEVLGAEGEDPGGIYAVRAVAGGVHHFLAVVRAVLGIRGVQVLAPVSGRAQQLGYTFDDHRVLAVLGREHAAQIGRA